MSNFHKYTTTTMVKLPPGRWLKDQEIIQEGDLFCCSYDKPTKIHNAYIGLTPYKMCVSIYRPDLKIPSVCQYISNNTNGLSLIQAIKWLREKYYVSLPQAVQFFKGVRLNESSAESTMYLKLPEYWDKKFVDFAKNLAEQKTY